MNTNTNQQGYWINTLRKVASSCDYRCKPGKKTYIKVVGVQYEGRLEVVAKLKIGEQVILRREPTNPYDYNAILIERLTGEQIGYVKRTEAVNLAVMLDDFGEPVPGMVADLIPASYRYRFPKVYVEFTIPESNQSQKGGYKDDKTESDI